jgi:hypothetical protein
MFSYLQPDSYVVIANALWAIIALMLLIGMMWERRQSVLADKKLYKTAHHLKTNLTKTRNIFAMLAEGEFGELPEEAKRMVMEGLKVDTEAAVEVETILRGE